MFTFAFFRNARRESNQPIVSPHPQVARLIAVKGTDCIYDRLSAGKKWVKDVPSYLYSPSNRCLSIFDLFGLHSVRGSVTEECAGQALLLELALSNSQQSAAPRASQMSPC